MKDPFTYKITKDYKLMIYRNDKLVKIVKGKQCEDFVDSLATLSSDDIQLKLAKLTGNYKRGNEKDNKS